MTDTGSPICRTLARTLPYGIAYHHSGLTSEERRHLEDAFRQNILCVICCTSTLAAGVNLPAKRVILRSPYVGRDFITLSRYKQMVGRAGRAGLLGDGDAGESILICGPRDNARVASLLQSPMDEAASSLHADGGQGVQALLLSAIGLGMARSRHELETIVGGTLMAVQAARLAVDVPEITNRILAELFRTKVLQVDESVRSVPDDANQSATDISFVDDSQPTSNDGNLPAAAARRHIRLKPSTSLCINHLGRAAFKSGFSVARARIIYRDLQQAQRSFVLTDILHLLYVVTPYEPNDVNARINPDVYYAHYTRLTAGQQLVARTLGISEQVALRVRADKPIKPAALQRVVFRFFVTLQLHELWQQKAVHEVADTFGVQRGSVQTLTVAAASYANGVLKLCEELDEFWAMRELLKQLTKRLGYCCTAELVPLMELPCVKVARAKQLFAAGYRTLEQVAKADVARLVDEVEHLNARVARQLVSSAKVLLLEKVESLREEVQDCLDVLDSGGTKNDKK